MSFQIEKMSSSHIKAVAALESLCFSLPWSENSLSSELENPLSLWLTAVDREKLLGYIGSQTCGEESDMMNLAVVPETRGKGIAKALLSALEEQLQRNGSHSLTLEVRASNMPAISLYEKDGFQRVGVRPGYYMSPKEDAWIYRKEF